MQNILELCVEKNETTMDTGAMSMVSYRGPERKGGVSSTLTLLANECGKSFKNWHFIQNNKIARLANGDFSAEQIHDLNIDLRELHYSFCNNTLWPLFHGMPNKISYKKSEHQAYIKLNQELAQVVSDSSSRSFLLHDYQMALLPGILKSRKPDLDITIFWHIPWPAKVPAAFEALMSEIVKDLAQAERIGFHTEEYKNNFLEFLRKIAPDSRVRALVAPLGIDSRHWGFLARSSEPSAHLNTTGTKFVLSVDRTDYTKGVLERLHAVRSFFNNFPEWKEKLVFVQHCGRTREGLKYFDKYWSSCRSLAEEINQELGCGTWQAVHWLDQGLEASELAALYRDASVMLVNPLRDGLNLTAKEFVSCQVRDPGVLVLSPKAGVYKEIGKHSLSIRPRSPESIAVAVNRALLMPEIERAARIQKAKQIVERNTLNSWWQTLFDNEDFF